MKGNELLIANTNGQYAHFVGFHDICPWDLSEQYIAVHRVDNDIVKNRTENDYIDVGLWDLREGKVEIIGKTNCWNWQQGARLQWFPGKNTIIYNKTEAGQLVSTLLEINSGKETTLPFPIYSVSKDGSKGLTYNFARLRKYWKGYGYASGKFLEMGERNIDINFPDDDGIFLIDFRKNTIELLLTISEVANYNQDNRTKDLPRFFTHAVFNPSGTAFCFFERFHSLEGGLYSRFFTYNMETSKINLVGEGKISHFDWRNDDEIMVWSRPSQSLLNTMNKNGMLAKFPFKQGIRLIRKLKPGLKSKMTNEYYRIFDIVHTENNIAVGKGIITADGHPMFSKDGSWFINDTYPDEKGQQTLMYYDMLKNERVDIIKLDVPEQFIDFDLKCDLHPRLNRIGDKVCVDSAHSGRRQVYIYGLPPRH